jgi:hypothetical protein
VLQPDADLPLLSWRPAPTPEPFTAAANPKPRDYRLAWDAFVEARPDVAGSIYEHALADLRIGLPRVEVNALFADARARFTVTLNNSWRAAAADWLCEREPRLADLIERRRRKVTK